MTEKSTVRAGHFDHMVWVKVDGRGTFQVSAGLKEYTRRMVMRGFRQFVIDLDGCELMDSTFMGTMAGIALRLRELGSGSLTVIHANHRNSQLLENLGLDHLFSFDLPPGTTLPPDPVLPQTELPSAPATSLDSQRSTMIAAHEALVEASPENESRFRDVLDVLKQESEHDNSEA